MEKFFEHATSEVRQQVHLLRGTPMYESYLYTLYSELIYGNPHRNLDSAVKVLERFAQDERVAEVEREVEKHEIEKHMDTSYKYDKHGMPCSDFLTSVAVNYMYACDEYGKDEAERLADDFFNGKEPSQWDILWVLGVETKKTFRLKNGCEIRPLEQAPDDCRVKRDIISARETIDSPPFLYPFYISYMEKALPRACIVQRVEGENKALTLENLLANGSFSPRKQQSYVAHLLNFVGGIFCLPITASYNVRSTEKRFANLRLHAGNHDGTSWFDNDLYQWDSTRTITERIDPKGGVLIKDLPTDPNSSVSHVTDSDETNENDRIYEYTINRTEKIWLTAEKIELLEVLIEAFSRRSSTEKHKLMLAEKYLARARSHHTTSLEDVVVNLV